MANRIGVYICHCGTNIAGKVDSEGVARYAAGLRNVTVGRDYKFMCSDPGQEMIIKDIREMGLNRVVVASCSPRMHEKTFQNACRRAGLNPFMFQMACIREHCSWVTEDPGRGHGQGHASGGRGCGAGQQPPGAAFQAGGRAPGCHGGGRGHRGHPGGPGRGQVRPPGASWWKSAPPSVAT